MLLFTRPLPKLATSAHAFEQANIDAVGVATSDIVDIELQSEAATAFLTTHLSSSQLASAIIVTSVYATAPVIKAFSKLQSKLYKMPVLIAVGDATATALRAALGHMSSLSISTPRQHTSEGILAMHQLNEANCHHAIIIKGEGGRDAIAKGLDKKGMLVNSFCVYKREQLTDPICTKRWKLRDVSGIIATSEAMATQLLSHYGNALLSQPWLTVSERIATTLKTLGVTRVSVCQRATDQALIAWVKDNWES